MKNRNQEDLPRHLLPEYDDYVDDALDLARGKLSPAEESAMRKRMSDDPVYKTVVDEIVSAEAAVPMPPAIVEASLRRFWEKAGMEPVAPVRDVADEEALADYAARTRARQHVWRRQLTRIGAVAATIVALMIGSLFFLDTYWTEHRTLSFVTSTISLADGSSVVLEPSSSLRHLDNMQSGRGSLRRDVYLDGSAEFVVRHVADIHFSVTTGNATVIAIGTRFHVQTREGFTEVRLSEGRVTVQPVDENGKSLGESVTLDPGMTARVVGTRVMVEQPAIRKTP